MFNKSILIFAIIFGICSKLQAQYLTPERSYTRADTLRGMLTAERSCYDVTYYDLTVKVDIKTKFISGNNIIQFTAVNDFKTMQVDLFSNLAVEKILYQNTELPFSREFNAVFIELPEVQKAGSKNAITIYYSGNPQIAVNPPWDGGFTFTKDAEERDWVCVSCEGLGASVWWPNKDHLSDEPDSMMIRAIVPDTLQCIANGNLRKTSEPVNGYHEFDWFVSYPINNYNVSINIGNYINFSDEYISEVDGDKLALDYYVLDYNVDQAKKQFEQVKPMLKTYEEYLGKYPFYKDGYALIEAPYLGMEHQSGIAYGNKFLSGYHGFDISEMNMQWDYIIVHESGHEWWGNNVSAKDIADLWLHESFCTYSESIYVESNYDYKTAMQYINARKDNVKNLRPMIGDYDVNNEGDDLYYKGMLVLNTIRHIIDNDELWWSILKGIQTDFAYQTITTKQIEDYISTNGGKDLSKVWDQYLRHASLPVLQYKMIESNGSFEFKYCWKTDVRDFNMPIRIMKDDAKFGWIYPTSGWQTFTSKKLTAATFKIDNDSFYFEEEQKL